MQFYHVIPSYSAEAHGTIINALIVLLHNEPRWDHTHFILLLHTELGRRSFSPIIFL